MAERLPPEVLDRIFAELCPFSVDGYSLERLRPWHAFPWALESASLVCSTWRLPAQKRLLCILKLGSKDDLNRLEVRLAQKHVSLRALRVCFYDSAIPLDMQLQPAMLSHYSQQFKTLHQMHVETHRLDDDLELSKFVRDCSNIRVLIIEHALEEVKAGSDYSYSDDDNYSNYSHWDPDRFMTESIAVIPSLMTIGIPALHCLQYLAIIRTDLGQDAPKMEMQATLKSAVFIFASIRHKLLTWLLHDHTNLRQLGFIQADHISKEALISLLSPLAPRLKYLPLTFPWPGYESPPFLTGLGAGLSGIVGAILPLCEKLHTLRCQDPDFPIEGIAAVATLRTLHATVTDTIALDQSLETGLNSLKNINIDVRTSYADFESFNKKWNGRAGLTVRAEGLTPIHSCPMREFRSGLPDLLRI